MKFVPVTLLLLACSWYSCKQPAATETVVPKADTVNAEVEPKITVTPFTDTAGVAVFPDATLQLKSPGSEKLKPGITKFNFQVSNFALGAQTADTSIKLCANSAKGQHIHFIMDNKPYQAQYTPEFTDSLGEGHHVMLAFLSRSYHESLKQDKAYVLKEFCIGRNCENSFDAKAPHLFFSRPKGEYNGAKETNRLLLDFYLINCTLSADGYKVRATINGETFMLTQWVPYLIEGLKPGEVKVKLELLDANNQPVASPFNGTERTVKLLPDPLQ